MARMPPTPSLLAAVLCDQAYQDIQTRKWVLAGTWNRLFAHQLPAHHPHLSIYFALGGAVGTYRTELQLLYLGIEEKVIASIPGEVTAQDRLQGVEMCFNIQWVAFAEFGKYAFRLIMAGAHITDRTFDVLQHPGQANQA
jgi:hypothetical protein